MEYQKAAISFADQVTKLKGRGLVISNDVEAENQLSNVSYYRLRAYTYPFQNNNDPNHPFINAVTFEQIIELYLFDRKLSQLIFKILEKIEVALRTQIIHQWALSYGSHWQYNAFLYRNTVLFEKQCQELQEEIKRSKEAFIEHYQTTYDQPKEPPSWMGLEVSSFGLLSQIYSNLKKGREKSAVAFHFGLRDISILENWMLCFSNIRNICAHHGRLWNRRFTAHIKFPSNPQHAFINTTDKVTLPYKLYAAVCCMQYMLDQIVPANGSKKELKELMNGCPLAQDKEMGFPEGWKKEDFWQ